jgi:hypothetical protein
MSTPSFIGILHSDRTVDLIYCHYDGYPARGAGSTLIKEFNSLEDAEKLVSQGWRSHLFETKKSSKVNFYGTDALHFPHWDSLKEYMENRPDIAFIYVWNEPVSRWEFITVDRNHLYESLSLKNLTNLSQFLGI